MARTLPDETRGACLNQRRRGRMRRRRAVRPREAVGRSGEGDGSVLGELLPAGLVHRRQLEAGVRRAAVGTARRRGGGWLLLLVPTTARGDPPVLKATPPWASVPRAIVGVEREMPKLGKLTPC